MVKAVHYLNQFFAGLGGEEAAETPPTRLDGPVGPGRGLAAALEGIEIVATIACGDDYFAEHEDEARSSCSRAPRAKASRTSSSPALPSAPAATATPARRLAAVVAERRASRPSPRCTRRTPACSGRRQGADRPDGGERGRDA